MKEKLARRLAIGGGGVLAIAMLAGSYFFYLAWALVFECSNEVLAVAHSPGGTYVATVIERNCGATTRFVRLVVVHEYGDGLDFDELDDAVYVIEGTGTIPIRWEEETYLAIGIAGAGGPAFKKSGTWHSIAISYGYWYGDEE